MPKGERDFTTEERSTFANPWRRRRERLRLKWLMEKNIWGGKIFRPDSKHQRGPHARSASTTSTAIFDDRPDLRDAVTPTYPYPGKRPIFATTFYPALKEPNVELVPRAVVSVTPTGIVDADGVERTIDVLVMATGFQPADYLARLNVVGRDGPDAAGVLGGRAARLPRHHGARVPQLLHALRAGHQRRRDRHHAREPVRVRGARA